MSPRIAPYAIAVTHIAARPVQARRLLYVYDTLRQYRSRRSRRVGRYTCTIRFVSTGHGVGGA
eukprot:1330754-Rhodomonas_salina.7